MIEAIKQALEALEKCKKALAEELSAWDIDPPLHHVLEAHDLCDPAVTALRQAIEQAEKQGPVPLRRGDILRCSESNELCTVWSTSTTGKVLVKWNSNDFGEYTAEQIGENFWLESQLKREWFGLTEEEIQEIALELPMDAVRITEAKLKEKNT